MTTRASPSGRWLPSASSASRLAVVVAAGCCLGGASSRFVGDPAFTWPSGGVLLAFLLASPVRQWGVLCGIALGIRLAAGVVFAGPAAADFGFAVLNLGIAVVAAWSLRRLLGPSPDLSGTRNFLCFVGIGVAISPAAGALLAGAGLRAVTGPPDWALYLRWGLAHAQGVLTTVPPLLLWLRGDLGDVVVSREHLRSGAWLAAFALLLLTVFGQSRYPLMFLIPPALLIVAWQLGYAGVVLGIALLAPVSFACTCLGEGPFALRAATPMHERLAMQQVFVLATFLYAHWIATLIADRRRHEAALQAERDELAASEQRLRESIADRQQQAEALRAANQDLDRLAQHLTRARDRAERANRAKSRFLAGMSHELRTPLNGILGYAQLLRIDGGLHGDQASRVDGMLTAGQHLLDMINIVLDISQIEAERVELRPADVDTAQVARACLDLVRPAAHAKGLALETAFEPDAPGHIHTDPTRLRQVMLNMVGNAVKFTAHGSVLLRLRRAEAGGGLRVEVADTGPGIRPDQRAQLFQDFQRLGADAQGAVEGAGLGLALSARLARLLGGSLGHEDNPGGGSIFWLELPLGCDAPMAEPERPDAAPAAATHVAGTHVAGTQVAETHVARPPAASGLRVLVVDDVAMNREITAAFLHAAGHHAACVEDGPAAVQAAAADAFDVVLMDVCMPDMDGCEATRRIRALSTPHGRVPIVALTAQVFSEHLEECHAAGMDVHLAKPFTQEALLAALGRAVDRAETRMSRPESSEVLAH